MAKSVLIQTILENNPVVDYLATKGHDPARSLGSRYKYSCPIHGPERTPSFFVFCQKEYQYYHCFGCKAHGDIINLVAALEGCDIKSAIGKLAFGMSIPESEVFEQIAQEIETRETKSDLSLEDIAIRLSKSFYAYLEHVEFDPLEVAFMETVLNRVDKIIVASDVELLRELYDRIVDEGIPARRTAYETRKEREAALRFVKRTYAS